MRGLVQDEYSDTVTRESISCNSGLCGRSDNNGPPIPEKITAFCSVAFGVIGFIVFLCFYCTPLFQARRNATLKLKDARRHLESPKSFLKSPEKGFDLLRAMSNFNGEKKSGPEPLRRIVTRDSFIVTMARHGYGTLEGETCVPCFPSSSQVRASMSFCSPLSGAYQVRSADDPPQIPPLPPHDAMEHESTCPWASHGLAPPIATSSMSLSSSQLLPAVSISNSQSLLAISENEVHLSILADGAGSDVDSGVSKRDDDHIDSPSLKSPFPNCTCGKAPSPSSFLSSVLSALSVSSEMDVRDAANFAHAPYAEDEPDSRNFANRHKIVSSSNVETRQPPLPIYADTILPHYFRATPNVLLPSQFQTQIQTQIQTQTQTHAALFQPWMPTDSAASHTEIQSLRVRDSIFVRASRYTRLLLCGLSGSATRQNVRTGTELQFEIVEKHESVVL
ncbi:hypothetical protein EW145_g4063 [Phellinidium pouzarii]|uniref:Uncharacterized protein n=1 Tax=Phellinidium pouzarii TaxID=167371 RepID=A0A4S4L546_9AGAM|nr:hypothetical protein EW145_g4063 [Phellinidium pouzarii]